MDDLVVWLRQQLDIDVAAADDVERIGLDTLIPAAIIDPSGATVYFAPDVYTRVCAVLDPERVRRDVEAKRRILDEHPRCSSHDSDRYRCDACTTCGDGSIWPCATIKLLALPYSERPGYREEWKP